MRVVFTIVKSFVNGFKAFTIIEATILSILELLNTFLTIEIRRSGGVQGFTAEKSIRWLLTI